MLNLKQREARRNRSEWKERLVKTGRSGRVTDGDSKVGIGIDRRSDAGGAGVGRVSTDRGGHDKLFRYGGGGVALASIWGLRMLMAVLNPSGRTDLSQQRVFPSVENQDLSNQEELVRR